MLRITAIIPTRNEENNISKCINSVGFVEQIYVVDSNSSDNTVMIAKSLGADVIEYKRKEPKKKKRQWSLDNLQINNEWILMLDADEEVTYALREEIAYVIKNETYSAYTIEKQFHFMGKEFRYGGFSFRAVILFRKGKARYETLLQSDHSGLDMEVHERVIVDGKIGNLRNSIRHEDYKDLQAYIERHNRYSTWEAQVRHEILNSRKNSDTIRSRFFSNVQERRRWLKTIVMRMPCEEHLWFFYHYILRLGILEGRRGLIACQIRRDYIRQVRQKMYEKSLKKQSSI